MLTTVGWLDIFTRLNQKEVIINALKFCQGQKDLELNGRQGISADSLELIYLRLYI